MAKSLDIIDAHIHTNYGYPLAVDHTNSHGIPFSPEALRLGMKQHNIRAVIAISTDHTAPTPAESDLLIAQRAQDPRIYPVCSINPNHTGPEHLATLEQLLTNKSIFGIKIFPGYHPVYPHDSRYYPFYELAGKHDIPVIIHTGDTFGSDYKVKFAHPLHADEIAVDFRKTTFILAHLGNPWVRSASELIYKNENVYADISAFCIGHMHKPPRYARDDIRYALEYTNRPDKFIYGSDWPLIDLGAYINLAKQAVPPKFHQQVFFENAKRVFKLDV